MVEEAIAIDQKNRNTLWQDAIGKEIENVKVTFQVIQNDEKAPNSQLPYGV